LRFLIVIALLAFSGPAFAKPVWVTQDFQGGKCVDVASGDVDKGED
jgi:hypothetical protein